MSDTEIPGPEATLAAEYVLGTLDLAEAEEAARRRETDPNFAAEVAFWEQKFAPLFELIKAESPPQNLWSRIEDSTGGATPAQSAQPRAPRPANDNRASVWRAAAFASLAVAASLAAYIAIRPPVQPTLAVLTPYSTPTPVFVGVAGPSGTILMRPTAPVKIAADRDLQLWAMPQGAKKPASLGVLPADGTLLPPGVKPGTLILVSLEPKGGSPTGQPTGPVLYAGRLALFQ